MSAYQVSSHHGRTLPPVDLARVERAPYPFRITFRFRTMVPYGTEIRNQELIARESFDLSLVLPLLSGDFLCACDKRKYYGYFDEFHSHVGWVCDAIVSLVKGQRFEGVNVKWIHWHDLVRKINFWQCTNILFKYRVRFAIQR